MRHPWGPRIEADATAEATFQNLRMAAEASGPDGVVYLELRDGRGFRGRLDGATPTHLLLSGKRIAVADIQTYEGA